MNQWPTTRNTLLVKLAGDDCQSAWFEFSKLYEPVIYRFARRRGLQHVDAIDLTQQVMLNVLRAAESWEDDERPQHFRRWLKTVTRNSLVNLVTREAKHRAVGEDQSAPSSCPVMAPFPSNDDSQAWQSEETRAIFRAAASVVRKEFSDASWQSFERTMLKHETVESVANALSKTKGAVYAARARVIRRLTEESQRSLGTSESTPEKSGSVDSTTLGES